MKGILRHLRKHCNKRKSLCYFIPGVDMDPVPFSPTSLANAQRRNYRWIGLGFLIVVVVVVVICLSVYLPKRKGGSLLRESTCTPIESDLQKFDCQPDQSGNESTCMERGCCYIPTVTVDDSGESSIVGVPSCFFPQNYGGYVVDEILSEGDSIKAVLTRSTPSGFPRDVGKIVIDVIPIDDDRLRIKIEDANSNRFEPEVPALNFKVKKDRTARYVVDFTDYGVLTVKRKNTDQIVFRSEISRLIFSDQFLQLSTEIPSKFIYGLGEQYGSMLRSTNWTLYTLFNRGVLPTEHRNLHGSHPFYLVMEPGGLFSGLFLLNSNAIEYIVQDTPAVTVRTIGGIFDFFLFLGPNPADAVRQYTTLFGRPYLPPRWSLGFHMCRKGLSDTKAMLERNKKAGIPVDAVCSDLDYMHGDELKELDGLSKFVKYLHQKGIHYVPTRYPGVSKVETPGTYPAFAEGKRLDIFIKDTDGKYFETEVRNDTTTVFPDFSNPSTEGYWKQGLLELHSKLDFDGMLLDANEPLTSYDGSIKGCPNSTYDDPPYLPGRPYPLWTHTLCMSARHNRTVHYNEHNLYGYRETKATNRVLKDITGKRSLVMSRASFSGQGVYGGHWSGDVASDWADMRYSVSAMLSFSLYGMSLTGSDICGFKMNATEELCARWHSLGAFYPFSRNHNDRDTVDQDPAAMGSAVIEVAKKALKIRRSLIPYLYTLFYRNYVYGETVTRPLFLEFPSEKETYTIDDEFLWGPALLIMPALEPGVDVIHPYIPRGTWYDLITAQPRRSKGERFELKAGLTDINLSIRGGYVLPAQAPGYKEATFDLFVALNSEGKAEGELFWDDGESLDTIEKGNYNLIRFIAEKNVVKMSPMKKGLVTPMNLRFVQVYGVTHSPNAATINGSPVSFSFYEKPLRISGVGHSLLSNITVEWQ